MSPFLDVALQIQTIATLYNILKMVWPWSDKLDQFL